MYAYDRKNQEVRLGGGDYTITALKDIIHNIERRRRTVDRRDMRKTHDIDGVERRMLVGGDRRESPPPNNRSEGKKA